MSTPISRVVSILGANQMFSHLIGLRGKPHTVASDNGTELTSSAILRR